LTSNLKLRILVGDLELDWTANIWDSMDINEFIDKNIEEVRERVPEGCYWNCCQKPGGYAVGCHQSGHQPKVKQKRSKVKDKRPKVKEKRPKLKAKSRKRARLERLADGSGDKELEV
jgi:hypothetical protein